VLPDIHKNYPTNWTCNAIAIPLDTEKSARGGLITQPSTGRVGLNIAGALLLSASITFAQDPAPTPHTTGRSGVTIEEVIVTGSNIPTSEEVGPNPVDTYRKEDITRLGANAAANVKEKGGYELSKIGSFLCHSDRSAGISSYSVFTKK
jgi:hypothetical protein